MFDIIPRPSRIVRRSGFFSAPPRILVHLTDAADACAQAALFELMTELRTSWNIPVYPVAQRNLAAIRCSLKKKSADESYELTVGKQAIDVVGGGYPGLFYGIQTLRQIFRRHGASLPCCIIEDRPAFAHRGFYLDISRGRVPRLETLRQLVRLLAHLKYNQLQLYVEHVFPFSFNPDIDTGCDVLTPWELKALDEYCQAHHIQLVPSLACFGHMGRILGLPAYRDLAELPWPARSWKTSRWIDRLRGATINPRHPRSRKLLRAMLSEFLPCFSSAFFNMCGDETYDLGRGANRDWVKRHGMAALYTLHVRFLHREAARAGKRLMLWGDMLLKYPDAIRRLPPDSIVLDWGYEPTTSFSKVRRFTDSGYDAFVCPSTRGYRVVFNETEKARANIAGYAREGLAARASGLLLTDWGDMGHFNMPAASLHGLAVGAAMAWNPVDSVSNLDRAFSMQLFGDSQGNAALAFRLAGTAPAKTWPLMLTDLPDEWRRRDAIEKAEETLAAVRKAAALFDKLRANVPCSLLPAATFDELRLACRAMELTAEKIQIFATSRTPSPIRRAAWSKSLETFFEDYSVVWRQHYKPLGLSDLARAFARARRRASGERKTLITPRDLP